LVRDLVEVGEKTGRLDEVLFGLADHYSHLVTLRRTFLIGIAWPSIQLFVAICVIGLLIYVLGMIGGGPTGEPIDILGFGLVGGRGLAIYVFLVLLVFGGGTLALIALLRGWFGTAPLRTAMQVPVAGGYLRSSALSRFAWTLSLALDSGLDARRGMNLALRSTQNPFYTSQLEAVDQSLAAGNEFHESLRITGMFPDDFLNSLETAEISGTHGESLGRLAQEYRTRATTAAAALTMMATVAVWVGVAAFIIVMIFRLAAFYIGTLNDALQGI
jgi:type II secretory pathway component PulF